MSDQIPKFPKRRIRWWWIVLGVLCVCTFASPFLVRMIRIASAPEIVEPFDIKAAGHVDLGEGENAFDLYKQAAPHVASMPTAVADAYSRLTEESDPTSIPPELSAFLDSQREVLNLFRLGSERPEAIQHQPEDYRISTLIDATQQLRQLARLAEVEALRLELSGDVDGAWDWHRATLRASRHSGRHGCLIERLVGCAIYGMATNGVVRWSTQLGVDQTRLRASLDELRKINRMTVPISRPLQVEYLSMQKTIGDPALRSGIIDGVADSHGGGRLAIGAFFALTEPDFSQRTARLAFANWLSQCDLPRFERAATLGGGVSLFDVSVGGGSGRPTVSAQEIQKLLQSYSIAGLILPAVTVSIQAHDRDVARQVLLETALALQIWHHEHGEYPESLELLVGTLLETPQIDPFGKGEPIRFRRESDPTRGVTIWSIGDDEVDNDGKVDLSKNNSREGDVVVSVKPPIKQAEPSAAP